MSRIDLTREQKNAVFARGSALLVSAAAGSGKTRVLTERLMSYVTDKDQPKDISSFLIITYTRAAAAELRARILDELSLRAAEAPENRRLRRQTTLCYRAQIGTIHSFCTTVLREHCHKLGLTPDFRVGDEELCTELREKALEKALDAAYEHIGTDTDFAALVDSVGAGRDDARLAGAVLELNTKMQSHPYPEKWAAQQRDMLDVSALSDVGETVWGGELMHSAGRTASYWQGRLERIWRGLCAADAENAPLLSAYGESLEETLSALRAFIAGLDRGWDAAADALPIVFPRLKPLKNYPYEDRKAALVSVREGCKKAMEGLSAIFNAPSVKLLDELKTTAPAMRALLNLTLRFDQLYAAEKRRRGLLDFSDLEHFSVKLLCDAETGAATETALALSRRYTEIMVDEYQDVNAVQDLLFRCISQGGQNLFMVGDVKQSIYRFRLADPSIFISKYHAFKDFVSEEDTHPRRILLQSNFRSDRTILGACNHVFGNLMSQALGEIDYDDKSALFPPENAPPARGKAEIAVLAVPQAEDGEERPDKTYLEAQLVARRIRRLVGTECILDNGMARPIRYGDIAILLRAPTAAGPAFRRALSEAGIPVSSEQGGGFFSAPEILITIALMTVIDNPHRDIPLAAALTSPVFGFTADELSIIRANGRGGDFYAALEAAGPQNDKCAAFLQTLTELRALSADIGVYELMSLVYDRLELPAVCSAMMGGSACGGNLMLLLDYAAAFEENGYRGLYGFLRQLKRMEARGEEPLSASGGSGNAVTVMSIHKSKGLEFPIVFLANSSREFNRMDLRAPVLIHPVLGLGCKLTDSARGLEYPTLARRAIASRLGTELLSEELRVLYVAMTRAKERLYISCTAKDPDALLAKLSEHISAPMDPEILKTLPSMAQWLLSAALLENGGLLTVRTEVPLSAQTDDEGAETPVFTPLPVPDEADQVALDDLRRVLAFSYPHDAAVRLPSKLTATSLPSGDEETDGAPITKERRLSFRLPDFMGETRPLTGAERGTATHIVMQFIDFEETYTQEMLEREIARIRALGQLTDRQAQAVDRASILRFFASDAGKRLQAAEKVYREKRFSLLCPAEVFFVGAPDEKLLLQGVVDCCIEENGALVIFDYKTDYVTPESLGDTAAHYTRQLQAYAYAMSQLFQKPVQSCLLCFLRAGLFFEMKLDA